jgi:hypothetical protein
MVDSNHDTRARKHRTPFCISAHLLMTQIWSSSRLSTIARFVPTVRDMSFHCNLRAQSSRADSAIDRVLLIDVFEVNFDASFRFSLTVIVIFALSLMRELSRSPILISRAKNERRGESPGINGLAETMTERISHLYMTYLVRAVRTRHISVAL